LSALKSRGVRSSRFAVNPEEQTAHEMTTKTSKLNDRMVAQNDLSSVLAIVVDRGQKYRGNCAT
jgi:hypothetical protein